MNAHTQVAMPWFDMAADVRLMLRRTTRTGHHLRSVGMATPGARSAMRFYRNIRGAVIRLAFMARGEFRLHRLIILCPRLKVARTMRTTCKASVIAVIQRRLLPMMEVSVISGGEGHENVFNPSK